MLNYVHKYMDKIKNEYQFSDALIKSENDYSMIELVVMIMKEFETIKNITLLNYEIIYDQDEIDYNYHNTNINFKKKSYEDDIPDYKYIGETRYCEGRFTYRIKTNLNETVKTKRILIPLEDEDTGAYIINDKRWKATWQLCDASTYNQRGKITFKSRMPIIIYNTRRRLVVDHEGNEYEYNTYSYSLNTKPKKKGPNPKAAKNKSSYINPLAIFSAKLGLRKALKFFGMDGVIEVTDKLEPTDTDMFRYYVMSKHDGSVESILYAKVDKFLADKYPIVQAFIVMLCNLENKHHPLTMADLDDKHFWICMVGAAGSASKNKPITSFEGKGNTTIHMIERLIDNITLMNLRLPKNYKHNVYFILRWMILNFDALKSRNNMDMRFKRIRKNEYIVLATIGKKVATNINTLIESKNTSRSNTMDTLLQVFNFNSDIILSGMRTISDLIKSDELVSDFTFYQDISWSSKGPNSLGESSDNKIPDRFRDIHHSMMGKMDLSTSSNSSPGLSGNFTAFVDLYNRFYFDPDPEPYATGMDIENLKYEYYKNTNSEAIQLYSLQKFDTLEDYENYLNSLSEEDIMLNDLTYSDIEIIEKE